LYQFDSSKISNPKMLGIKIFGEQSVKAGGIIVLQRGTKAFVFLLKMRTSSFLVCLLP